MTAIHDAYINALLADATYALKGNVNDLKGVDLVTTLKTRMTDPLATDIANNFTVVTHVDSDDVVGSGFDATVWRRNDDGKIFVSMTGTEGPQDFLTDADLALSSGAARVQIAEMVNWWLKISTPTTAMAAQITLVPIYDNSVPPQMSYEFQNTTLVPGLGLLNGATSIELNGHSLGGHLASAFALLFGASPSSTGVGKITIDNITTFNSAGFNGNSQFVFEEIENLIGVGLGRLPNSSEQTNYFAENGLNVTTNSFFSNQVGQRVELFNEESTGIPNHYLYKLTDLLALGDAIAKLDNNFSIAQLNDLVKVSSNQMEASYERLLDGFRKTIIGGDVFATGIGDASPIPPSRVDFHFRLSQLVNYSGFQDLIGQFTIDNPPTSIVDAKTDFGAFLSLVYLTPFALKANDAGGTLYLQNSTFDNTQLAAKWELDKNLTPEQIANGEANFTDNWLTDRIAMLAWQNIVNQEDIETTQDNPYVSQGMGRHFYDFDSANGIYVGIQDDNTRQIIFGDETANGAISGLGGDDHLYGGAGNDTLTGNKGNDHLEGNEDNDNLNGGAGTDKLLGGQGDDSLAGGKGDDILQGGKGNDTYIYTSGDGFDTIVDSDGLGKIQWDGLETKGSGTAGLDPAKWKKLSDTVWQDEINHITYSLKAQADGSNNLYINKLGDELEIKGWQDGNLGIALGNGADPVPPAYTYNGDQHAPLSGNGYDWGATTWAADGTLVGGVAEANFNDVIIGDQQAPEDKDTLNGLGGNDALDGREGDDTIDGGDGDDLLGGGKGSDTIHGGAGNDMILSATGLVVPQRTKPDEVWPVPAGATAWIQGSNWGVADFTDHYTIQGASALVMDTAADVIFGDAGDDRIIGGLGSDYIDGGLGKDTITGHGGNDLIDGGDGDDYIRGDGLIKVDLFETVPLDKQGSDTLFGGAGADTIIGNAKDDRLFGGKGDDALVGDDSPSDEEVISPTYYGNDYLDGGEDNDLLIGGGKDDTLTGGVGDDVIQGDGKTTNLAVGYHGDDYLDGGDGNDVLVGGGKNDTLIGGAGNDRLHGDSTLDFDLHIDSQYHGNDYLDGGDGNDVLLGNGGVDTLLGGLGIDLLSGGDGNDYLDGGDGDDLSAANGNKAGNGGLDGGAGDDTIYGGSGNDGLLGGEGNDFLDGGAGNDRLTGSAGDDRLLGGAGVDLLQGDDSNDYLDGGDGDDLSAAKGNTAGDGGLAGGAGDDTIDGGLGRDELAGGDGQDLLNGGAGDDFLYGEAGNDTLTGGAGSDYFNGGAGDDTYQDLTAVDVIFDNQGNDTVIVNDAAGLDPTQALTKTGNSSVAVKLDNGATLNFANAFFGTHYNLKFSNGTAIDLESLIGSTLNTSVSLQLGNDGGRLYGGAANDTLHGGTGNDILNGNFGNDTLRGGAGNNILNGGDGDDYLVGNGLGINAGISGNDVIKGDAGNDTLTGEAGNDTLVGGAGIDYIQGGTGDDVLDGGTERDTLFGDEGNDILHGEEGDDLIYGNAGDDVLDGGTSTSSLHDYLYGGEGSDTYLINVGWKNAVINNYDTGIGKVDTIQFGTGISAANINLSRSGHDLILTYTNPSNGENVDTLTVNGYFYFGDYGLELIRFTDGTTWDVEAVKAILTTGSNQNDHLQGYNTDDALHGLGGDDSLFGNFGDDVLVGGDGNDYLDGGFGSDTYIFNPGWGIDTIYNGTSYADAYNKTDVIQFGVGILPSEIQVSTRNSSLVLTHAGTTDEIWIDGYFSVGQNTKIDQVRFADGTVWNQTTLEAKARVATNSDDWLYGTNTADTIDGLEGYDQIYGLSGDDTLIGNAGDDFLEGGPGSDTYFFDRGWGYDTVLNANDTFSTDVIQFGAGIAPSDIQFKRTYNQSSGGLYDMTLWLTGTTDTITVSNFWLNSKLYYSLPTDYQSYNIIDKIQFADSTVWDLSQIVANALLGSDDADILVGFQTNDVLNGRAGNDLLSGDGGNDIINGGTGNDELSGDIGSDTYQFDRGWGQDEIYATTYATDSSAIDVIQFAPDITTADIQVSRDGILLVLTLVGTSNTIWVQRYFDVIDPANVGIDEIRFADGTVWDLATVINMTNNVDHNAAETLVGTKYIDFLDGLAGNDTLFGLDWDDTLSGGDGDDYLDGGAGTDTMVGGLGNDTYIVDSSLDSITENLSEGTDTVQSGVTYTLASLNNVENLILAGTGAINGTGNALDNVLTGNNANNTLTGNAGNDTLDGDAGNDTLRGGTGNDIYIVDSTSDIVTENLNEGTDTVRSNITIAALSANVENLVLIGANAINGTGNTLNNSITGNSAANTLDGGAGNDTMAGGLGDDIYVVNSTTDVVTEMLNEGIDTIRTSVILATLASNVENLVLLGTIANGTGNTLNNTITGNSAANTLDGGQGIDTLIGAAGNDTYIVDNSGDIVTELLNEGTDLAQASATYTLSVNVENLTLTGTSAINGTGNTLNNLLTGNSGINTLTGGAGDDTYFITSGDTVTELSGEGTDTVNAGFTYTLAANVENLVLTGTTAINGTGNGLNNTLTGNSGANTLTGLAGDDTYIIGTGDTVVEAASAGTDTVQSSVTYTLAANVENLALTGPGAINGTGNTLGNILAGNSGANVLNGKAGNDTLTGGLGTDIFLFDTALNATTNRDVITDFNVVDDTIRLENAIFSKFTTTGSLNVANFVKGAGAKALDANDYLVYNTTTGSLSYDADGSGAGAQVEIVSLTGIPALTAADFNIV